MTTRTLNEGPMTVWGTHLSRPTAHSLSSMMRYTRLLGRLKLERLSALTSLRRWVEEASGSRYVGTSDVGDLRTAALPEHLQEHKRNAKWDKYELFPQNRRPISLLSSIVVVAETVILNRLRVKQLGFMVRLSTDL